jgi:DNA repair protein RecO (recombination protein O)
VAFATDGVITRVVDVGVSDKLLHIITADHGRIAVMVKGGRSPNGKNTAVSQLFTYGNFEIGKSNSIYWLRGGSVINPFYDLSTDIVRVSLASYLCDLANELTDEEDEGSGEIMRLLLNSLYLLGRGEKDMRLIKAVFEFRAATVSGYCPELAYCAYCRAKYSDFMYLDVMGGKLVCTDCMAKRNGKRVEISKVFEDMPEASILCGLSPSALAALRYIVTAPDSKIFSFELKDDGETNELSKAAESYILNHLERGFDSLEFYKSLK